MSEEETFLFDAPEIPEVAEEELAKVVDDTFESAIKFAIIGSGAGGCRLADAFYKRGYQRVFCINTTEQDMMNIQCPNKLIIDAGGASKDPNKGKDAISSHKETLVDKFRESFGEEVERIIVCVGAGGGTGTGSALVLLDAAKKFLDTVGVADVEKKVGILVTIPKRSESKVVQKNAYELLKELFAKVGKEFSPLMVLDNDTIYSKFPNLSPVSYWPTINNYFVNLFHAFNVLADKPSEMEVFDKTEFITALESGVLIFGAILLKKFDRGLLSESMRDALNTAFLAGGFDITSTKFSAAIAVANEEILSTHVRRDDIDHAMSLLGKYLDVQTVCLGIYQGTNPDLRVYTIASGLDTPVKRLNEIKKRF